MKKLFVLLLPVAITVGCAHNDADMGGTQAGTAGATGGSSAQLSSADMRFIKEATVGGIAEVKMGYMGVQNGTSPQVRNLGQKLIQDHTAANKELEQIAGRKGVVVEKELDAKHQRELDQLTKLTGPEFDKAYLQHAVMHHQKDIKQFQTAAEKATDQDLRAFAQRTLPVLQQHLEMAKSAMASPAATTDAPTSTTPGSTTSPSPTSPSTTSPSSSGASGNTGTGISQ